VGILLSGSENRVVGNYLAKNEFGLFFGTNEPSLASLNLTLSHNSFQDNLNQMSGCFCPSPNVTEPVHMWDDGKEGNYWSDYNGTDANGDGIGDSPYVFDAQNVDRFPLMESPVSPPVVAWTPFNVEVLIPVAVGIAFAVSLLVWGVRRRRRSRTPS
jgi:nitrous oxidase accessory protein NosD